MTISAPTAPEKRRFANQMFDTAFSSAVLIVVTLLTGIALARLLGPDARGVYGALQFWSQLGVTFLVFAIFEATVIRVRISKQEPESAVPLVLIFATLMIGLGAIIAFILARSGVMQFEGVSQPTAVTFLVISVAVGFVSQAFIAIETAGLNFTRLNIDRVFSPVLFLLAVMVLYVFGIEYIWVVLGVFVGTKLPLLFIRFYRFRAHLVGPVNRKLAGEVIGLAPRLYLASANFPQPLPAHISVKNAAKRSPSANAAGIA